MRASALAERRIMLGKLEGLTRPGRNVTFRYEQREQNEGHAAVFLKWLIFNYLGNTRLEFQVRIRDPEYDSHRG
jgi:hypothetical protein